MAGPTGTELSPEAQDLKDNGNKYFVSKDYAQALQSYEKALALCPASPILLSNAAACQLELKQWQSALEMAEKCLEADTKFVKAYGRKAMAQLGLTRPGDAEKTLLAGLKLDPGNEFMEQQLREIRKEDGEQRPVRSRDGSDRALRDLQGRAGMTMTPAALPNEAFQAAYRLDSDAARGSRHSEVLAALLAAGARVDAKDVAGWTALHHATAHHAVLDLARQLLAAGADVNLQDRYGTYPLVSAVMSQEVASVRLLLEQGAKADLKDNDGCDALMTCRFHPEMLSLIHNAHYGIRQPGAERPCATCGQPRAKKACSGCSAVSYCNRECQKAHWKAGHKDQCGKPASASSASSASASASASPAPASAPSASASPSLPRELRVPVLLDGQPIALQNMSAMLAAGLASTLGAGAIGPGARMPDASHGVLELQPYEVRRRLAAAVKVATKEAAIKAKLQVPAPLSARERKMMAAMGEDPDAMMCYNQDRSLVCKLDGASAEGRRLTKLIREKGIRNLKGYFAVFFDESCRMQDGVPQEMVVVTRMLPAQPW